MNNSAYEWKITNAARRDLGERRRAGGREDAAALRTEWCSALMFLRLEAEQDENTISTCDLFQAERKDHFCGLCGVVLSAQSCSASAGC